MCLILFAYKTHPHYPLIVAANRDEFYDRPTDVAAFWPDYPDLLAGKDLSGGGTWLGITRTGRFGALTNYRDLEGMNPDAPTRGRIIIDYLTGEDSSEEYLSQLAEASNQYNKFSVILGTLDRLYYFSNAIGEYNLIPKGVHGLCNHLLDTPWQKVVNGKQQLENLTKPGKTIEVNDLLSLLADETLAPESDLPDAGVNSELEKVLSPIFINSLGYGTRCSTILIVDQYNSVSFFEKTYPKPGTEEALEKFYFTISGNH